MLINCRMWTTLPQTHTLLKVSLSCTFLKTMKFVIKMIIKGRCPTMRHVSRTHRVALDWLFDRINLDPKIQVKYVHTRNQLADMLTIRAFTRDEWHHLLQWFDVVAGSVFFLHPSRRSKGRPSCHVEAANGGKTARTRRT